MQDRSERTRRKLVHAGAEMFNRLGYANATLTGIATCAGVTKGALYFHFASKDDLAEAVRLRGAELLHESVGALRATGLSPLQTLVDTTHWLARGLRGEPAIPAGLRLAREGAEPAAPGTDFHQAWLTAVCALLRQARDAGELRPGLRWESIESLVVAASCGIEALAATGIPDAELQRRVAGMWSLLLPSLVPAGAEADFRTGLPGTDPAPRLVGEAPDDAADTRSRRVFTGLAA
ncbi:TetR/AcrR family transcriptional regulator [Streptomyces bambusae]|uniref:ScbR family autoregulator-binding transcription factor n=1 Tax=Streptomyces bambusae TaxID=1550616 RepID=UPI001CFE18F8|nr:ScbR family autoregulator-binding transcription factor [Streptomyces bambusae]MCB5168300.1 TetR/AcrR family transcriptional regulator [Streptomyces bambusae]